MRPGRRTASLPSMTVASFSSEFSVETDSIKPRATMTVLGGESFCPSKIRTFWMAVLWAILSNLEHKELNSWFGECPIITKLRCRNDVGRVGQPRVVQRDCKILTTLGHRQLANVRFTVQGSSNHGIGNCTRVLYSKSEKRGW